MGKYHSCIFCKKHPFNNGDCMSTEPYSEFPLDLEDNDCEEFISIPNVKKGNALW